MPWEQPPNRHPLRTALTLSSGSFTSYTILKKWPHNYFKDSCKNRTQDERSLQILWKEKSIMWLCCSKKGLLYSVQPTCWTAGGAQKFFLSFRVYFTCPIWGLRRSGTSALISLWSPIAPGEGRLMGVNQLMGGLFLSSCSVVTADCTV